MGITGLLPLLKPVTKDMHIRDLKGLTVGVDTYCWLHKGIYSCSAELCQGIPTDKFIKYCVERVHLLLSHGVKPYLVFDGGYLPAKGGKEEERRVKREANLQRGMQLLREGNASGALQFFSKAADVTPLMAHNLIQVIKRIPGARYVVAPYEADAQLGFLARNGHVDAVITEDSDIILFGCTRVVFKLDRDGTGQEVDLREVFSRRNDELDMRGKNEDDLMMLCALSGCDYLPSVHGVGLKKAHRLVSRHKELPKILRAVKFESAGAFPRGYEADFHRALLTFRHQRAFDPVSRTVVHMTPLPEVLPSAIATASGDDGGGPRGDDQLLDFLGPPIAQERGCAIADGEMDPITGQAFAEISPNGKKDTSEEASPKIALNDSAAAALAAWRGGSTPAANGGGGGSSASGSKKKLSTAQGNNLTKYWGTPLSSKKPLHVSGKGEARGGGGGSSGSGGGGDDYAGASGGLGSGATSGGGVGCGRGTPVRGAGTREDVFAVPGVSKNALDSRVDSAAASPAEEISCVSPASFYAGVSPFPTPPTAYTSDSEDKENRDPLLPHEPLKTEDEAPGTSKHFGGGGGRGGGRGGGLRAATSARFDARRKRFRSPLASLAAPVSGRSPAASGPEGGVGGDAVDRHRDAGLDAWGENFSHQRLETNEEMEGVSTTATGYSDSGSGGGGSSGGSGGSRLKRRRTLGVGSLAPRGLIRGLDGGAPGQRSKSLGGVPAGGPGHGGESENDGDDAVGPSERCASNLFDRFAARSQPLPARTNTKTRTCGAGARASEAATESSERATVGSAAECDERLKDRDGDMDEDREVVKAAEFGDGPTRVVGGPGGSGRGGALSELSVNSVATRSVLTCREGLGVSPSPVGKGKRFGPDQACAVGGSGAGVSQVCGRRRRGEQELGKAGARAVCGGGGDCSSSGSKFGGNDDAHGKVCNGRRNNSGGVEGVRGSHGGGGGGGGDRERSPKHTGGRIKKAAGGGKGSGGDSSGGVDGGDLFTRFMYNA